MIKCNKEFWNACDRLISSSEIVIDRPKSSSHPRFPDMIYPVDYGYLKDTASMDGGGIDLWLGSDSQRKLDAIICIVDLLKRDSEIKLLLGCTEDEKQTVLDFHNSSELMKGIIILRHK
jgi:inorganic pyrophosphatase